MIKMMFAVSASGWLLLSVPASADQVADCIKDLSVKGLEARLECLEAAIKTDEGRISDDLTLIMHERRRIDDLEGDVQAQRKDIDMLNRGLDTANHAIEDLKAQLNGALVSGGSYVIKGGDFCLSLSASAATQNCAAAADADKPRITISK